MAHDDFEYDSTRPLGMRFQFDRDAPTYARLLDGLPSYVADDLRMFAARDAADDPEQFGGDEYRADDGGCFYDYPRHITARFVFNCQHERVTVIGYGFRATDVVSRITRCNACGEVRRGCRIHASRASIVRDRFHRETRIVRSRT